MQTASLSRSKSTFNIPLRFLAVIIFLVAPALFLVWLLNIDNFGVFTVSASFADLDGDGRTDVVAHNLRQESAFTAFGGPRLWINQGGGQLSLRDDDLEGGWHSAAADLDGDGDSDLAVFRGDSVRFDINQGGAQGGVMGVFRSRYTVLSPDGSFQFGALVLGDLDNDGQLDGIATGCCSGSIFAKGGQEPPANNSWAWRLAWNSEEQAQARAYPLADLDGLPVGQAALGDLDGDGDLDLFAAVRDTSPASPADRVLFNDGAGAFSDSGQRLGDRDSTAATLADLDGDGDLDALIGGQQAAYVWINQGSSQAGQAGMFVPSGQELPEKQVRTVFLADFDGDGDPDALVAGVRQAVIWWNDGLGQFSRSNQRFTYTFRHGVGVGDIDGDGLPDIFIGLYDKQTRAWLNQGGGIFR